MADSAVSQETIPTLNAARVDPWLEAHIELLAILALAAGFVVRVAIARSRFLVADEALDYLLVNQASALEAYRQSLGNAHPPLLYFVLYYWRFLGTSELALRFPSVIAGTVMPWLAFLWLKRLRKATAFLALLLLTFAPALITFSTEIRPYALLLMFLTAALWSLDRAFERNSAREMLLFGAFLCLAIFTQYSAIWAAAAMGIYALVRIFFGELKKAAIFAWMASQVCALAILGWLWATHISKLHNGAMESVAVSGWLRTEYFQVSEHVFRFALRATADVFLFLMQRKLENSLALMPLGIAMTLFFLFGVVLLLANRADGAETNPRSLKIFGIFMLLPFVAGYAGALLRLYPYGGSRHVAYLAPFAMAGIAFGIAWMSRRAFWAGIVATAALLIACNAGAYTPEYLAGADQARGQMVQAVKYLGETAPAGSVILVDYNSSLVMRYYLCSGGENAIGGDEDDIRRFACGEYEMARARGHDWTFTGENLGPILTEMKKRFGWKQGEAIWLIQVYEMRLDAATLARFGAGAAKDFDGDIFITRLRAP
jgi:uncharacterized membrane protein